MKARLAVVAWLVPVVAFATFSPVTTLLSGGAHGVAVSNAVPSYFSIITPLAPSVTRAAVEGMAPALKPYELFCVSAAPNTGNSRAFTYRVNDVDTDWSCTISDAATSCTDFVGADTGAGTAAIYHVPTSTPDASTARCSLAARPAGGTGFVLSSGPANAATSTTALNYQRINGIETPQASEAARGAQIKSMQPSLFACQLSVAPGVGSSYTMTFRAAAAATDWACTVSDLATSCEDTVGGVIPAANDASIETDPTGTPIAAQVFCTTVATTRG